MPCTNVTKKKELTSRKQIAGQKSKNLPILLRNSMLSRLPIRRGMPQAGALLKKSLVNSQRWPTAWREARQLSEHLGFHSPNVWAFTILDCQRHDLGTATCSFADSSLVFVKTRKIGDTSFWSCAF